jgi:FAD/FMN-containing dehydrogenase/Fe-S oxidoreductase
MDQLRERIQADLRGLLDGEVRCDDLFTQMYASDASLYEIRPLGVVRPQSTDDVVATVRYATEHGLPIHPRGAGTGLAGESLGPGIVLDFSHAMRRVLSVSGDTVTVQPGVIHGRLNRQLAIDGRMFGPDPATGGVTTMGSVIALDGAGSHWLKYGSARRHVVSLQLVLASGDVIEAGPTPLVESNEPLPPGQEIARRMADLVRREQRVIEAHRPRALVNRCGYQLHDILEGNTVDLGRVVAGSEGTLGIITQATVRTVECPQARGLALFFFDRLEAAALAAGEAAALGLSSCDLLDRRLLTLARDVDPRYAQVIPREAEALLLVEAEGAEIDAVRQTLQEAVKSFRWRTRLAFDAHTTFDPEDVELYRRLSRRVVPMLYRIKGSARPLPFVEDIAVPPDQLAPFLTRLRGILKQHGITASLFGHAGHGQLHLRPFLNPADPADVRTMQEFAKELYEHVVAVSGTISGEHGAGLSRTWFLKRQYGPLYDVFREVKRIFDPNNLLNAGKVVADVPQPLTKNLRSVPQLAAAMPLKSDDGTTAADAAPSAAAPLVQLHLHWEEHEFAAAAQSCNGCGRCRTFSPDYRMCPVFRFAPGEEASPRAKANLLRSVLAGTLPVAELSSEGMKQVADLCVNCHQCRLECPAGVDIPKLVIETKSQYVATNGLRPADRIVGRLDWVASVGMKFRPLVNWAIGNRTMRWIMERTLGIAQRRKLPRLAKRTFLRMAQRRRLTRAAGGTNRKVLYFVDVYANWFDTELAEATVAVLRHNGVSVYVHPGQLPSGMARIAMGDVERARRDVATNVRRLAEAVRQGYEIVTSEPSAALCLKHEYPNLLGDDDSQLVAQHTSDVCDYLWRMHCGGELELDLKPQHVTAGYHLPCHVRALTPESPGEQLLRLIPGLTVERIDRGCSGMAGTFGLRAENFRNSLRAGFGMISALRNPRIAVGTTECSACKMQMEQGTTKPTIHPMKLLALAYGLMPDLRRLLQASSEELYVT